MANWRSQNPSSLLDINSIVVTWSPHGYGGDIDSLLNNDNDIISEMLIPSMPIKSSSNKDKSNLEKKCVFRDGYLNWSVNTSIYNNDVLTEQLHKI